MATLSGQKIKEKFGNLLQVEGGITSTTKDVEDGTGDASALKISTTTVEIDGTLNFTAAPSTDNAESTALLIDSSDNVVKRELGTAAFKDEFPRILARAYFNYNGEEADKGLTTSTPYKIIYAPINNNSEINSFNQDDGGILTFLNSARKIVNIGEDGVYKISISLFLTDCANTIISTNITKNPSGGGAGVILCEGIREKSNATSKSMISFYTTALLGEDDGIEVNIECTSGTATLKGGSTLDIEKIA